MEKVKREDGWKRSKMCVQMRMRERGVCGMDKNRGCEVCRKKRYPMTGKKFL